MEHPFFVSATDSSGSLIFNVKSVVSFLKELSFALFIALIIVIGVERESRQKDIENNDNLRRFITKDVLRAIFSRKFDKTYVDKVLDIHFESNIVRKYIDFNFSIEVGPETFSDSGKYVSLRHKVASKIINVGTKQQNETLKYEIPRWVIDGNEQNKFISFDIMSGKSGKIDMLPSSRIIYEDRSIRLELDVILEPDDEIELAVESITLEYASDTQPWCNFLPTMQASIIVTSLVSDIAVGMTSRTATPAHIVFDNTSNGSGQWKIGGPILPNDTIIIWWNKK